MKNKFLTTQKTPVPPPARGEGRRGAKPKRSLRRYPTPAPAPLGRGTVLFFALVALFSPLILVSCSRNTGSTEKAITQTKYHCPMHPSYVSEKPGNCPICGMQLVLMESESTQQNAVANSVPGQSTVKIPPERQQLIGVTVAPAETRDLTTAIRASARVAYDPNLYNAILEHQQALASLKSNGEQQGNFKTETTSLIHASELRLRQMGLSDEQIKEVSRPGFDASNLLLSKPGGKVWIYIDIYDYEAPLVKAGQKADITSAASPGKIYTATVRAVDTILNSETRTLRARAETVNTDGALRPEMYLNAVIHVPAGRKLAVPETAVIDTGTRQLVYVEKSAGEFEPRIVTLGKKAEGFYEVIAGVKEGERVVTSANFLVDSESKLKAAVQGK